MKTGVLSTLGRFNQCVCVCVWGGGGGVAVHFRSIQPVGRRGCCPLTALSMFKRGEGALHLHGYIGNQVASCMLFKLTLH